MAARLRSALPRFINEVYNAKRHRRSARRTPMMQAGAKKWLSNRTKKLEEVKKELMPAKIP
jgi:hypothetical protein